MTDIPEILNCRAYLNGSPVSGLMLQVNIGMSRKNSYSFIFGPTDSKGYAALERSRILKEAKAQLEVSLMDFDPIEEGFNGEIKVIAMSKNDIRRALNAFQLYDSVIEYSKYYKQNLEKAMASSKSKDARKIEVEIK